jgi:hypothetical protein
MQSLQINFRISAYNLARGLQLIYSLEPNYKPVSISKIVKTLYLDYIAKMTSNKTDSVHQKYIDEIKSLVNQPVERTLNLEAFIKQSAININTLLSKEPINTGESSIITSVSDFSPPKDWEV